MRTDAIDRKEAPAVSIAPSARKSFEIKLTDSDRALLQKLDREHREKMEIEKKVEKTDAKEKETKTNFVAVDNLEKKKDKKVFKITAVPNPKSKQTVSYI